MSYSDEQIQSVRRLIANQEAYSAHCLKVLSKEGNLVPFIWNKAQRYIHAKLEQQLQKKGYIRALILKGRQQGCCLAPETNVLTADLRWVRIDSLKPGQELVAVDEETSSRAPGASGGGRGRKMRTSTVEAVVFTRQPSYRITLDDGRELVTSSKHRWLVRKSQTQWAWRSVDGTAPDGRDGIKVGDKMRSITSPWGERTMDDAWFGGVIDGEGSLDFGGTGVSLAVSQRANGVLLRMDDFCAKRGYGHYIVSDDGPRKTKLGQDPVHAVTLSNLSKMFEVMGKARPERFIGKRWWEGKSMPDNGERVITNIEFLGEIDVVDIQTSTGTFLAEGIVSHNSTYVAARYYNKTSTNFGRRAFIVSHEEKSTQNLFAMVKRYDDHNPLAPSKKASNAQELVFGKLDSGYKLATAGSKDVGRGNTAQLLHGCLAPDTLILDGVTGRPRRMDEFQLGDLVRTHTGAVAPVSVISRQVKFAHEVVLRTAGGLPLRATGEHKFWTRDGMKRLDEMRPGDEIGFPIAQIADAITIEPFKATPRPRPQGGGSVERVPDEVVLNYDIGRILGLYLAEGTVQCQSTSGEPSAVMFAVHEDECDRTIHWLGILAGLITSINVYRHKDSKTVVVTAYGRSFASFVARMCGRTDNKVVPPQWRLSGAEFARGLLHGYLSGDGGMDRCGRRISATSVRPAITVGMRDVAASLGYGWASIDFKPGGIRHGRNERDAFTFRLSGDGAARIAAEIGKPSVERKRAHGGGNFGAVIDGGYAWLKIASISDPFESEVMDFEVDHEDHSYCTIQVAASNSEFGFWQNAQSHLAGIGNSIPLAPGTEIILESTANGLGNAFHEMWQNAEAGIGEYMAIFVPWMWQDEYRLPVPPGFVMDDDEAKYAAAYGCDAEQMVWRRAKLLEYGKGSEWLFDQEYPATPSLAFRSSTKNPLINPGDVNAAVQSKLKPDHAPLIIGCDPAGDGAENADRTAIAFRRGRVCLRVEYHSELDTMAIASKLAGYFNEFNPDAIFIDKTGLGTGVYDRLRQLNVPCVGVNNAERARDPTKYENKRAEMWWTMKQWFEDVPCRIPNDAALIADVCAPQPAEERDGHKLLESKKDMKKRGIRSPDGGDALALTFAEPVSFRIANTTSSGWSTPSNAGY